MSTYEVRQGHLRLGILRDCRPLDEHNNLCVFDPDPAFEEHRPLFDMWLKGLHTDGGEGLAMWLDANHAIEALGLHVVSLDTRDEVTDFILTIYGDEAVYRRSS